ATIDHHDAVNRHAVVCTNSPRRRKDPIAWATHVRPKCARGGKYQRLACVVERRRKTHSAVFVACAIELSPLGRRRQCQLRRRQAFGQRSDQGFLPSFALKLPRAERNEDSESQQRRHEQAKPRALARSTANRHGSSPNRLSAALW